MPVGPLTARIRLPEDARPKKVQLLTSGKTVPADVRNGVLRVTVPSVDVHEVIAIDF
jgi:HSP20 family molecular chaperone IbpA